MTVWAFSVSTRGQPSGLKSSISHLVPVCGPMPWFLVGAWAHGLFWESLLLGCTGNLEGGRAKCMFTLMSWPWPRQLANAPAHKTQHRTKGRQQIQNNIFPSGDGVNRFRLGWQWWMTAPRHNVDYSFRQPFSSKVWRSGIIQL